MGYDVICVGTALVDSIIRGFDPTPVSASGYVAESGTLSPGGEAVNEAVAAAKLGLKTGILCSLGNDQAGEGERKDSRVRERRSVYSGRRDEPTGGKRNRRSVFYNFNTVFHDRTVFVYKRHNVAYNRYREQVSVT